MRSEQTLANRLPGLEKVCSHRHGLQSGPLGSLRRRQSLQIDEVENLALPLGQLLKELMDDGGGALAIDAPARIGSIDIAWRLSGRRLRQKSAALTRAAHLGRCSSRDSVEPRVQRSVRAVLAQPLMRAHEYLLTDVLGFVGIARENQRPAKYGRLKASDKGSESGIVARGRKRYELRVERVGGAITVRRAVVARRLLASALPKPVKAHGLANIWLRERDTRLSGHWTSTVPSCEDATSQKRVY